MMQDRPIVLLEELYLQAKVNISKAINQIVIGGILFCTVVVFENLNLTIEIQKITTLSKHIPNEVELSVIKWCFVIGASIYTLLAFIIFTVSVHHRNEAKKLLSSKEWVS
jgi:hypothetical protein